MMLAVSLLLCCLSLAYWAALELLRRHWQAIPVMTARTEPWPIVETPSSQEHDLVPQCAISIVVVVRNEALNLPLLFNALSQQTLSPKLFELHLVDDASTDTTWQTIQALKEQVHFPVYVQKLTQQNRKGSPKKAAITQVLTSTAGALIVVSDGDCQPGPAWLEGMLELWKQQEPVFISGPVRYVEEHGLFERMQAVEFSALIGVGAAMLQAGKPGMCNAANMAFSKKAFDSVGGYVGNEHVPSGDDEFLLQKLAERYPDKIRFLKLAEAVVSTRACASWLQFMHQRKRWAGKWRLHKGIANKLTAVGLALYYLLLLVLCVIPFFQPSLVPLVCLTLLIKAVADYRFLAPVLYFLKKRLSLKVFLLMELVYPFYVLFFAVAANIGGFTWKERSYRYSTSAHERAGISNTG